MDGPATRRLVRFAGIKLPEGLRELRSSYGDTPSTKADRRSLMRHLTRKSAKFWRKHKRRGEGLAQKAKELTLAVYRKCADYAPESIIIADTKFEFGLDEEGNVKNSADEVLTPDSSRFWPVGVEAGR